jgi:hypothetical protein
VLAELGACVETPDNYSRTPVYIAAYNGHAETVGVLAELGACIKTPNNDGRTPVHIAAQQGHAEVIQLLARLKADITTRYPDGWTPLALGVMGAHFDVTKALLLLGAPITIEDLKQYDENTRTTRQLRADLQAWAADALAQHRIFYSTFLFGCTVHPQETTVQQTTCEIRIPQTARLTSESAPTRLRCATTGARVVTTTVMTLTSTAITAVTTFTRTTNATLPMLEGVPHVHQLIAEFVGVVVGEELRHTRAMGTAIAAIDWAAHDEL